MANPEHLKILKQGVEAWNKWREDNPDITPDLHGLGFDKRSLKKANLSNANLRRVRFNWVDLSGANLRGASLIDAGLSKTDLSGANLVEANFGEANLNGANLTKADLTGAYLGGADLRYAHLRNAKLSKADLSKALLSDADFWGANLSKANLSKTDLKYSHLDEANFTGANLRKADLRHADLKGAKLNKADLSEAVLGWADVSSVNLSKANISGAYVWGARFCGAQLINVNLEDSDLRHCELIKSDLTGAILTGVKLYGTARDEWIIKDVKCRYVYWDSKGKERCPKDRDLEPGEFERLYEALPTIEYIFEKGMTPIDPLIMDRVVQAIRETKPEFDIKIDSINARGLAPSVKFTVQHEEQKKPALKEVQKGYDERISRLESEKERLYQLLGQAIDKAGVKLITAGPGAIVATDGSTINIQQHIHNALELQKSIADEPEESKGFAKVAKKTALDIIGGAIKDIAKGQVKEAAKEIIELGKDLGPIIAKMAAYSFFSNIGG